MPSEPRDFGLELQVGCWTRLRAFFLFTTLFAMLSPWQMGCVAMSPILGHIFSPFFKGKGGKGVATTVGVWFALGFMHFGLALGMFLCLGELGKFFYFAYLLQDFE